MAPFFLAAVVARVDIIPRALSFQQSLACEVAMRSFEPSLWQSDASDIDAVTFDPKSRDDIPQLLRGLQYLYMTESCRVEVLQILDEVIPEEIDRTTGRPGMALWRILVMGVLRLNLNWDYDRLCEMVNEHRTIRQMLGHGRVDDGHRYHVQTLKDNVSLLTPEIVDRINQVVVKAGHGLEKKRPKASKKRWKKRGKKKY